MKIVLDARWIFPEISGIGLYTQELIGGLAGLDAPHEFVLLFDRPEVLERTAAATGFRNNPRFAARLFPVGLFAPAGQLRLPLLLRSLRADVYHSTNYMMPLLSGGGARRVVTIHDLIPLLFRDHAPKAKKARLFPLYRRLMIEVARRADLVITVSESTRRDVLQSLGARPDRTVSILEGVRPEYRPGPRPDRGEQVILFVGRRDPYKNLPLLVESFAALRTARPVRLRVIGPPDDRYPEAPTLAERLGVRDRIDWIGYAPPERLVEAYQQADVFVLPSRYEGFGLTVLEAMASGAPVVCSNVSSLPEVVGDAAELVPPGDRDALTQALARVLGDPARAAELRARGLQRAARFTWAEAARQTLSAYEQAALRD